MIRPTVSYDKTADVLYLKDPDATIASSAPLPGDDFVILNRDKSGAVVGLQLVSASEMTLDDWLDFYHVDVPKPLFGAVSKWLFVRQSKAGIR